MLLVIRSANSAVAVCEQLPLCTLLAVFWPEALLFGMPFEILDSTLLADPVPRHTHELSETSTKKIAIVPMTALKLHGILHLHIRDACLG